MNYSPYCSSDADKVTQLERDISFEQIVFHLSLGDVWKVADHPNQEEYPGQRIYFVNVDGYRTFPSFLGVSE
jgi:hypothetical protein